MRRDKQVLVMEFTLVLGCMVRGASFLFGMVLVQFGWDAFLQSRIRCNIELEIKYEKSNLYSRR